MTGGLSLHVKLADKGLREFGRFARKNKFVAEAVQIGGCAAVTIGTGGAGAAGCGVITGAVTYGVTDGDTKAAMKSGAIAYVHGAISLEINDAVGLVINRPIAVGLQGILGGSASAALGGKFNAGFYIAAGIQAINFGMKYMENITDAHKLNSCLQPGALECRYNKMGELLTDGGRGPKQIPGTDAGDGNWLTNGGMADEGTGCYFYDPVGSGHLYREKWLIGRFVNQVSKVHDWFNSDASMAFGFQGYDRATGLWLSGSETYNSLFQVYSFGGMLPAAAFTSVGLSQPLLPAISAAGKMEEHR